jgi:3-isopropylmalate/(R)-2-methylmalate dehydratase small subunit
VNSGLPIFSIGEDAEKLNMGDRVRINVKSGHIQNLTSGEESQAKSFPDFIMAILEAGGIGQYILSRKSEYNLLK